LYALDTYQKKKELYALDRLEDINAQHTPNSIQTNKSPSECVKEKPG
jgi:hypothetical protein